jgi:uncharacterized protein (TIGR03067 family)
MVFRRGDRKDRARGPSKEAAAKNPGGSGASPALKGDLARLQGKWTAEAGAPRDTNVMAEIKGTTITISQTRPGESRYLHAVESIRIDETATPRTMDFTHSNAASGRVTPGIYELDGETLKLAVGDPGGPRPSEFRSGEGGKAPHLLILRRRMTRAR